MLENRRRAVQESYSSNTAEVQSSYRRVSSLRCALVLPRPEDLGYHNHRFVLPLSSPPALVSWVRGGHLLPSPFFVFRSFNLNARCWSLGLYGEALLPWEWRNTASRPADC